MLIPCPSDEFDRLLTTWQVAPGFMPRRNGRALEYWVGPHLIAKVEPDGIYAQLFAEDDLAPAGEFIRSENRRMGRVSRKPSPTANAGYQKP